MPWSTRQLAELAGTTLKTVRYYHDAGLLEQPERSANGYKQYGISHLVRLLRIKRLADLGVPLAEIATMGADDRDPQEALRLVDRELEASIERLQRVRAELALILRDQGPVDLPPGFSSVAADMPEADRAMLLIYSRVFSPEQLEDIRQSLADGRSREDIELASLPEDSAEETRDDLARRLAAQIAVQRKQYPSISSIGVGSPASPKEAKSMMVQALVDLYNRAQLDVLQRAAKLSSVELESATTDQP